MRQKLKLKLTEIASENGYISVLEMEYDQSTSAPSAPKNQTDPYLRWSWITIKLP